MPTSWRRMERNLSRFVHHGLAMDQMLAGQVRIEMSREAQTIIATASLRLAAEYWADEALAKAFPTSPLPWDFGDEAAQAVLVATAEVTAALSSGRLMVEAEHAAAAERRLQDFVSEYGFVAVVDAFAAITAWENCTVVSYYGSVSEREFIRGELHRPQAPDPLDSELIAGQAAGFFRVEPRAGVRHVWLTPRGQAALGRLEDMLTRSGYFAAQGSVAAISGFNAVDLEEIFRPVQLPGAGG